jgi:hypothetical protein
MHINKNLKEKFFEKKSRLKTMLPITGIDETVINYNFQIKTADPK